MALAFELGLVNTTNCRSIMFNGYITVSIRLNQNVQPDKMLTTRSSPPLSSDCNVTVSQQLVSCSY